MPSVYEKFGVYTRFDARCSWVTSPWLSPVTLASFRLTIAVYTMVTLIVVLANDVYEGDGNAYLSYFTRLSYVGLCAYFWASGLQTAMYALSQNRKTYPLQQWSRFMQFLHVLLFATITTFPFIVTLVFWVLLASANSFQTAYLSWNNISVHALNSVFALLEMILTNAGPAPWLHVVPTLLFIAGYLGVAYITYATQGFYTYSFLNPEKQKAKVAVYIVGIALGTLIAFTLGWSICTLRTRLTRGKGLKEEEEERETESLSEWQDVDGEKVTARII